VLVAAQPVARVRSAVAPGELLARWLAEAGQHNTSLQPRLLRRADGRLLPLHVDRWAGPVTAADLSLLTRARGPVLDVGCGPGRLTAELHRRGVTVLGLDVLEPVPVLAYRAGAPVHLADVFGPLPGEGTWGTALLADGNVGIGGDATALLKRVRALLAPGGTVLCELEPDAPSRGSERVRLEGLGCASEWFRWALLGPDALPAVTAAAGLTVREVWEADGRAFAALDPAP
jgi:SAM-dependent methyltransferase